MDTNIIPFPASGQISLLVAPGSAISPLFELVARLALQGRLYVLDGGNTFQGYTLARTLRSCTADRAPLERVLLSRAFTCYQMSALLCEQVYAPHPILVLDFLSTFYDQSVRIADRRRLLLKCLQQLRLLSGRAPVAVWVRQRTSIPQEAIHFLDIVERAADHTWYPYRAPALPAMQQLTLFPA